MWRQMSSSWIICSILVCGFRQKSSTREKSLQGPWTMTGVVSHSKLLLMQPVIRDDMGLDYMKVRAKRPKVKAVFEQGSSFIRAIGSVEGISTASKFGLLDIFWSPMQLILTP